MSRKESEVSSVKTSHTKANSSKQETAYPTGYIEGNRQTRNRPPRWNWVAPTVWTPNMLTALDNGVKGNKWFSLIDKLLKPDTLLHAWLLVSRNKGAAGIDKQSIEKFQVKANVYLAEIRKEIREDRYQPKAVRRVEIPKGDGKTRPLGIPTVKDRIVQTAVKLTIEPIFEKEFYEHSYGFRPGRGAKDALREVHRLLHTGHTHIVDVDFKSYFDTIPHDKLIADVEERVSDGRILALIRGFLKQGVINGTEEWKTIEGTPQGGVISPLLANIYLNKMDHHITQAGYAMVRYADDFVVMTKTKEEASRAKRLVEEWAEEAGLIVHPEKSKQVDYRNEEPFEFLGYQFCMRTPRGGTTKKSYRFVSPKGIKKIRETIRTKTPKCYGKSMKEVIADLNRTMKGWYVYFKQANKDQLRSLDGFIRRRLRAIYRKREKRPGFGHTQTDHRKWPNKHFADLGLFTIWGALIKEPFYCNQGIACQSRCRNS